MRVLADLGGYEIGKPFVVTRGVLDTIEKLLEDPSSHDHIHSPLDIIDPMLAKTGISVHYGGQRFNYRPFKLKYESIKSIRQRAISLIDRCLHSNDLKITLRALASLESALQKPQAYLNMDIADEDLEQWRPEQLEILTLMVDLARRSAEPVTLIRIRKALSWHRRYSPFDEVKAKAEAVVSSIPESFELRLTQELMDPFHMDDWQPSEDSGEMATDFVQRRSGRCGGL